MNNFFDCTVYGQLNDTRGYHIKPTNSMCNMISYYRLSSYCGSVI